MKVFNFGQANNFGDSLELTLVATSKEQAKEIIRQWIIENAFSIFEVDKNRASSMFIEKKQEIDDYKRICKDYNKSDAQIAREIKFAMNEKVLCVNGTCYSVNDWLADKKGINDIFYQEDLKRTYLWTFDNEKYDLDEVQMDKSGVVSSTFVYCGR